MYVPAGRVTGFVKPFAPVFRVAMVIAFEFLIMTVSPGALLPRRSIMWTRRA